MISPLSLMTLKNMPIPNKFVIEAVSADGAKLLTTISCDGRLTSILEKAMEEHSMVPERMLIRPVVIGRAIELSL